MPPTIGDRDNQSNTLQLGGWIADVWATTTGDFLLRIAGEPDIIAEDEAEALAYYNELNGTKLKELPLIPHELLKRLRARKEGDSTFRPENPYYPKGAIPVTHFSSQTSPGTYHYVYKYNDELRCTCPGFGYRKTCRHIQEVKEA